MIPRISIIIPTYSNATGLRACLDSIIKHTKLDDIEIICVANGAPQETRRVGHNYPVRLLWYDEPIGYTVACNIGMKAAQGDYFVLLNDDCVVLGDYWLNLLIEPFLTDERMAVTGPLMLTAPECDRDFLVFFCVMIRRKAAEELAYLDEIFNPGYAEDCDFALRAVDHGWKIQQVPPSQAALVDKGCEDLPEWKRDKMWHNPFPIYHDGNQTFGKEERFSDLINRNSAILRERYGVKELNTWRAKTIDGWFGEDEIDWLAARVSEVPKGAKVLEIGSWHGRSSRAIADNLPEGAQAWCVDTWIGSSGEPEMHGSAHYDRGDHAHQWWWCNLQEHISAGRVVPVRMHSDNASRTIAHLIEKGQMEKFDLIFIDGDHSDEGIRTDVEAWLPLLKDGGLMCGHDYYKENEGPYWVHVRQYVEVKFPQVEKAATSIWYVRPHVLNPEPRDPLAYQINEAHYDMAANPEYAKIVESSQRAMVEKLFAGVAKDAGILDVGCGNGVTLKILREQGFTNLSGVDVSAQDLATITEFDTGNFDMHEMPFPDGTVDVIYCSHALEHAYDPLKALNEFKRLLKPDGQLLLVLPYPEVLDTHHRAMAHCGAKVLGLTQIDNAKTLLEVIEGAGFTNLFREEGTLRNEREIYLKFEPERAYIYDCFIFNNEFDVLEIRLATLSDTVDRFVLVEGTQTHSGNPKPLHFDENKERFAPWLNKIEHVVIDNYPEVTGNEFDKAWTRERHQRDGIMHGLKNCKDSDIILIGDADEIASPEAIKSYVADETVRLKQRLFYYYLNCENKEGWDWHKITRYKKVKERTPCGVRYPPAGDMPLIENGGWHFSFLGGAAEAIQKVKDYAHREYDTPELMNVERVTNLIEEGRDIFGRDDKYEFVPIDDQYPECVQKNFIKYLEKGFWHVHSSLVVNADRGTSLHGNSITVDKGAELSVGTVLDFKRNGLAHKKHWSVTAEVSTKDRYHVLPTCLTGIINQSHKPDKLKIYDDGEQKNLFELSPFGSLLKMAQDKGIEVEVLSTPREGQVTNHQHCLDMATTDFIWRVDDDEIPDPNVLQTLLDAVRDHGQGGQLERIGAVGGLVHHPAAVLPLPPNVTGSMSDLAIGQNLAWYQWNGGVKEVDHLYSTFMYRVDAAKAAGGYPRELSPVGHREETIFSHRIKRAGYKLLVTPHAKTIHLQEPQGGIRSFNNGQLWEHDEQVFQAYLKTWDIKLDNTKVIVCDFGLGDHLILKAVWNKIKAKHPEHKWVMALCFPEVFKDETDVTIVSIAEAKILLGHRYDEFSVYRYAWDNNFVRPMADVMLEFFSR